MTEATARFDDVCADYERQCMEGLSLTGESASHFARERVALDLLKRSYLLCFPSWLRVLRPLEPSLSSVPLGGQYAVFASRGARAR